MFYFMPFVRLSREERRVSIVGTRSTSIEWMSCRVAQSAVFIQLMRVSICRGELVGM